MDRRLIVTSAFTAYVVAGALFALGASVTDATFTEGQLEFVVVVGYLLPTLALGLVWLRNYAYAAPLLAGSALATSWFVTYFFVLEDNPANVAAVSGDGASAYLASVVGLVAASLVIALVALWVWYAEIETFRTRVDRVLRPAEDRE